MTRRFTAILLTLLAMTLAAACSSDDDASEATSTTEAPAATSETGASGSSSGGGAAGAPDLGDFEVPLPEWVDAVSIDDSGPFKVVLFTVPLDQRDATVAFYEDWTDGQPETYLRTGAEGGGITLQTDATPGEDKTIIAVLSHLEGDDFVAVTLSRGTFE